MMNRKINNRVKRILQITMILTCVVTLIASLALRKRSEKSNRG